MKTFDTPTPYQVLSSAIESVISATAPVGHMVSSVVVSRSQRGHIRVSYRCVAVYVPGPEYVDRP
jgi:hypothetical protein